MLILLSNTFNDARRCLNLIRATIALVSVPAMPAKVSVIHILGSWAVDTASKAAPENNLLSFWMAIDSAEHLPEAQSRLLSQKWGLQASVGASALLFRHFASGSSGESSCSNLARTPVISFLPEQRKTSPVHSVGHSLRHLQPGWAQKILSVVFKRLAAARSTQARQKLTTRKFSSIRHEEMHPQPPLRPVHGKGGEWRALATRTHPSNLIHAEGPDGRSTEERPHVFAQTNYPDRVCFASAVHLPHEVAPRFRDGARAREHCWPRSSNLLESMPTRQPK